MRTRACLRIEAMVEAKKVRFRSEIIFAKIARAKIRKLRTFTSVDFSISLLLNWHNRPVTNKGTIIVKIS
jgi:hypothetical protein